MKIEVTEILITLGGLLLGIIGYFLIQIHSDFKKSLGEIQDFKSHTFEELGKLKGKIELVEQSHISRYELIEKTTQLKIQNLTDNINKLTNAVEKFISQGHE